MIDRDLQKFCSEILLAVNGKAIPHWFNSGFALCTNAGHYDKANGTFVYSKLREIFGLEIYPFNEGDITNYRNERWQYNIYKNEKRLAFLKKYAEGV